MSTRCLTRPGAWASIALCEQALVSIWGDGLYSEIFGLIFSHLDVVRKHQWARFARRLGRGGVGLYPQKCRCFHSWNYYVQQNDFPLNEPSGLLFRNLLSTTVVWGSGLESLKRNEAYEFVVEPSFLVGLGNGSRCRCSVIGIGTNRRDWTETSLLYGIRQGI